MYISVSYNLNRETQNIKNTYIPGLLSISIFQGKQYKTLLPINVPSHICNSVQSMAAMKTFLQENVCVGHTGLDCNLGHCKSKSIHFCRKAEINSKYSRICCITFKKIVDAIFCSVSFFEKLLVSNKEKHSKS